MDKNSIIKISNISKEYLLGKEVVPVLHDINFRMNKGQFTAIMGPSGSGKSTLLNILGCLDTPSSGKYILNNHDVSHMSQNKLAEIRNSQIGFIFQNFNLLPKLDIIGNVELPLIYANTNKKHRIERVNHILDQLGLWERRHHKPNEISGGQKQRVAIARALIKNPSIILADEPTGNLDSTTSKEIMDLLQGLHSKKNTILMITHENSIADYAEQTFHLIDGKLNVR